MSGGVTKSVRITLAALTRVEYSEVLEVPVDISEEQLDQLVEQRFQETDGGEFLNDPDYWERGHCYHAEAGEGDQPNGRVVIQDDAITVVNN